MLPHPILTMLCLFPDVFHSIPSNPYQLCQAQLGKSCVLEWPRGLLLALRNARCSKCSIQPLFATSCRHKLIVHSSSEEGCMRASLYTLGTPGLQAVKRLLIEAMTAPVDGAPGVPRSMFVAHRWAVQGLHGDFHGWSGLVWSRRHTNVFELYRFDQD